MGVAAYQRGTQALKEQFNAEANAEIKNCFEIIARLNSYPKGRHHFNTAGVVRLGTDGNCYIMNQQETGWASYSYGYPTMKKLIDNWNIEITGFSSDEYSPYYSIRGL